MNQYQINLKTEKDFILEKEIIDKLNELTNNKNKLKL